MPINNLPASLQSVIQTGFLQQQFQMPLRAKLGFRSVADREPFSGKFGETVTKTRTGLLPAVTSPLSAVSNSDITNGITPGSYSVEQYTLSINQYGSSLQLNIVTSGVAIADLYTRNAYNLGEQAYRSIDQLAQRTLFNTYLGGNTRVRTTLGSAGPTVAVDDIRGFTETLDAAGKPVPVSSTNPVNVVVGDNVYSLIGFAADGTNVSTAPTGVSGTLTFSSNVTVPDGTADQAVVSSVAPYVMRPSDSASNVMAATTKQISASAQTGFGRLTMQMILNAKATLSANGVPPSDETGMYNLYLDPIHATGLYSDPAFQQFFRGQMQSEEYRQGVIAQMLGVHLQETNLNPVQDLAGVGKVRRGILCGQGAMVEGVYTNEGYQKAIAADNDGMIVVVDGVSHVTREPLDFLSQVVTQSWAYIGGFAVPSDVTANPTTIPTATNSAFKRAIVLESL